MAHQERKKIMKTWKKIVLGVSLISLFLGGGLATWGYSQGGLTDLQNQTKSEQEVSKIMSRRKLITSIRLILKVVATMFLLKVLTLTKLRFLTTKKQKLQLTHL